MAEIVKEMKGGYFGTAESAGKKITFEVVGYDNGSARVALIGEGSELEVEFSPLQTEKLLRAIEGTLVTPADGATNG